MTLQLTNNLWELRLETAFDANLPQHLIGEFTSPFVIGNVTSEDTVSTWKQAGSIGQAIAFENSFAYGEVTDIKLNSYLLLQFPLLTGNSYQLYYFPLPRLVEAKIKIWEYKGETVDISLNNIAQTFSSISLTNIELPSIEKKLKQLNNLMKEDCYYYTEEMPTGYYY